MSKRAVVRMTKLLLIGFGAALAAVASGVTSEAAAPTEMTITKAFSPTTIAVNGVSTLTFTLTSPAATDQHNFGFTDNLPVGLVVASPPNANDGCGGFFTLQEGGSSIKVDQAAQLTKGQSCKVFVDVSATTGGVKNNSVTVSSNETLQSAPGTASLTVTSPPTISKDFAATSMALNSATTLTFTLTNASATPVNGVAFTDNLPTGLVVANPNGLVGSCGNGTITADNGSSSISLSGGTMPANSTTDCNFLVNVKGTTAGTKNNTTGNVTSTEGGSGLTASDTVTVVPPPPTIVKSFGAASIPLNGSTALTFTITNPDQTLTQTGIGFIDTLPAGLVVAPSGLTGACDGGTITAVPGSSSISLSGASLTATGACNFLVDVKGTGAGTKNNSVQVSSAEGGAGNTSNASVTVIAPPTIAKTFTPKSIPLNATSSLGFTITNPSPNSADLTGVGFSDTLPTGLTAVAASTSVRRDPHDDDQLNHP